MAALSTGAAALFLYLALGRLIVRQIADGLVPQAMLARDLAAREPDLASSADALADRLGRDLRLRVTVIAADGTVLGDSELDRAALDRVENHAGRPEFVDAERSGAGRSVRYSHTLGIDLLYVAVRIDPSDPSRGVLRLAVPLTEVQRAQRAARGPVAAAALASILVAAGLGWMVSRRLARRLAALSIAADAIAAGTPGARARAGRRDEVGDLGRSLNRTADQLEERLTLLSQERNQLQTVLEGMAEGVLLTDETGRILLANGAFERIFDARPPLRGRRPLEAARVPALQEAVEAALGALTVTSREIELVGRQEEKVLHANLSALRSADGTVEGAVAVFHDVTELKRLEKTRREFVANVSHELRTPLTAIKGFAETLLQGGLDDKGSAAEFVRVIERHAERLRTLIEDLLDLAAVEQGRARLRLLPTRPDEAAAQALAVVRSAALSRGLALVVDVPAALPLCLADKDRLAEVLINLLDNAVKYTPEGGTVRLSAAVSDGHVEFVVSDTGIGIAPDDLERVFERFYRADRSRDRRDGGTGLGLAIAKHLVLAMSGTIGADSAPGSGSTFRVLLPLAAA